MSFAQDTMRSLVRNRWDGNVRELRNLVESLVVLAPEDQLRTADLPTEYRLTEDGSAGETPERDGDPPVGGGPVDVGGEMTMDEIERRAILGALEKTGGNRTQAAERLGIGLRTLQRKLKDYRLSGKAEGN